MAITQIQKRTASVSSTNITVTATANFTDGNLLVAIVFSGDNTLNNPGDGTWTTAVNQNNPTESDNLRIAYKIANAASTQITFTQGSALAAGIEVFEYSGISTSNPFDTSASTARTTGATSLSAGTTPATDTTNELILAGVGARSVTSAESVDSGYTLENAFTLAGLLREMTASFLSSGTGAQSCTFSWTTAATVMGVIATFRSASTGAAATVLRPQRLTMLGVS